MKFAVQYRRISDKDQSYHSLASQSTYNLEFAEKNGYTVVNDFIDDGRSAKNFNRPGWKALVQFLRSNTHVKFVLIYDYSRFSRNAGEALELIERYERVHNIHILSVSQHIPLNPSDPMYFDFRARMLVHAETERRIISDRTLRGIRAAREGGRLGSLAPYGYINVRRKGEKPNIEKTGKHDEIFEGIFTDVFEDQLPLQIAHRNAKLNGFNRKGKSAFRWVLENPAYYGLVYVPEYRGKKSYYTEASFEGYFPKEYFYIAQGMFGSQPKIIFNDEVPLRGILKGMKSDKALTAGKSKGNTKYYWYYRNDKQKEYYSAIKVHKMLKNVLQALSFKANQQHFLIDECLRIYQEETGKQQITIDSLEKEMDQLYRKLDRLESQFIEKGEIDAETYKKWNARFYSDIRSKERQINALKESGDMTQSDLQKGLEKLTDIYSIYENLDVMEKQRMILMLFGSEFRVSSEGFGTLKLNPIFMDKYKNIKQLRYLQATKKGMILTSFPEGAPSRT